MSAVSTLKNIHEFTAQLTHKYHDDELCNNITYTRRALALLWEKANKWRKKGVKCVEFDLKINWNRAVATRVCVVRAFGGQKIKPAELRSLAAIPTAMLAVYCIDNGSTATCVVDLVARELRIRTSSPTEVALSAEVYTFNALYVPITQQEPTPIAVFLLAAEAIRDKKIYEEIM